MKETIPPMMKNMIAVTIQTTMSKLGPVPDKHGDLVKSIMAGDDSAAIMALGCHLEDCHAYGSWDSLDKLQESIDERNKQ